MKSKIIRIAIIFAVIIALGIGIALVVNHFRLANALTDEEAREVLADLIPKSEEINRIVWGEGLSVAEGEDPLLTTVTGAQYRRVDEAEGYKNTDELAQKIATVYSNKFINSAIKPTMFDGDESDPAFMIYARYKNGDNGELLVNIVNTGYANVGKNKIDYSNATVKEVSFTTITVEVDYIYENGTTRKKDVKLIKQSEGWRLDTPTY